MRILQIVQKPQRRGAEIFAYQLSQRLRQEGNEVKTAYLYPAPGPNHLQLRNGDFVIGENENHFTEKIPGWNPAILRSLRKAVTDFNPDIIQVNAARTVKYGALLRSFDSKGSWALVYRNIGDPSVWQRGRWKRWFYKNCLISRIDGIVAVSEKSCQTLKAVYQRNERIVRIPRAVDVEFLVPAKSREEVRKSLKTPISADVLIYVGSLTAEKRIDRLLRLSERLASRKVYLWILGDGPLRQELEKQATELVQFLGTSADVASYIQAADLFVLSSATEGIPGAVLEAALLSVPAVATRVGGVPECIRDLETGILVDSDDELKFETAVRSLLDDAQARRTMGEKAREFVQRNFSLSEVTYSYLRFYKEILAFRERRMQR